MRKHYTVAQRAELTSLVASGVAPSAAAARLGVPESTAYNWLRVARARGVVAKPESRAVGHHSSVARVSRSRSGFARLVRAVEEPTAITLRVGAVSLEVQAGFDAALLHAVIAVLAEVSP